MDATVISGIFASAFATITGVFTQNIPLILGLAAGLFALSLIWGLAKRFLRGRS